MSDCPFLRRQFDVKSTVSFLFFLDRPSNCSAMAQHYVCIIINLNMNFDSIRHIFSTGLKVIDYCKSYLPPANSITRHNTNLGTVWYKLNILRCKDFSASNAIYTENISCIICIAYRHFFLLSALHPRLNQFRCFCHASS